MEKITSRKNPVCIHVKKLGKSKSYRDSHGEFLCAGKKLFHEAIKCGAQIDKVLTSADNTCKLPDNMNAFLLPEELLNFLSPLESSQDLLFTCMFKESDTIDFNHGTHILLDSIQDPGNIGTLIRSARAFGVESVILTGDCADIYNPKTIRGSMGAIFNQKITKMSLDDILALAQSGIKFIGASNKSESLDIKKANLINSIIILGSEGHGISQELLSLCDKTIKIPISKDSESLNVAIAGSIIMWEAALCHH